MAVHIKHDKPTRAAATAPGWLPVGKQIGTLANQWSDRSDLVAYVGPGAGGPAPACYSPDLAEIEVNVDVAFGFGVRPSDIDLTTRAGRYEFPRAVGAIAHEAFHAEFSAWDMAEARKALEKDEFDALMLLEESRIEYQGVTKNPRLLAFLRSCAMEIVIADAADDFSKMGNVVAAANLVGLVYARVDAGILPLGDVTEVTDLIDDYLGLDKVAALRELAIKFQEHEDHSNALPLYPIAREWARIVREACDEKGEPRPGEGGSGSAGEGDESEGEGGEGGMSEFAKAMMDAMRKAAEAVGIGANDDLADAEARERSEEIARERSEAASESAKAKATATKVFVKSTGPGAGGSWSTLAEDRAPKPAERAAAVKVAQMLERAKYRERGVTEVHSTLPPGRLRTRALVQREAMRAKGVRMEVAPFERKVRKHTDQPELSVGVIVDISGSMGAAMEPMATTAYVMAAATHRVQGRCAMAYYGNSVFPTLRPGERMDRVRVYTAPDGTEKFDEAFRAVDGALPLLYGTGARLLVVVSDGCYVPSEIKAARHWLTRCKKEGVAVVWLPFDGGGHYAKEIVDKAGHGTIITGVDDPAKAAMTIGKACADALTEIGNRV